MTKQEKDRIECAIRHIQTAVDVDPWAVEIAADAMKRQIPTQPKRSTAFYFCPNCGSYDYTIPYCRFCGQHIVLEGV